MTVISNPLELYNLLPKSNCRQCRLATCLAFAAAVIKGQKVLRDCPLLAEIVIKQLDVTVAKPYASAELQLAKYMDEFKREIGKIDLPSAARRLGATSSAGKLTVKCLGKRYTVDKDGNITSECHINQWVVVPLINYILYSPGNNPAGHWVPFRELEDGVTWNPLFGQRCEKPLKHIADDHLELFEYLLYVFGGKPATNSLPADISLVLHPLPKFPVMICYSRLEQGTATKLNIFFDQTAEDNLNIESVFALFAGLVTMLEKITARHS